MRTKQHTVQEGLGRYYHVEVSPKTNFDAFYTKDVGRKGHSLLVLGRRKTDGKWATHKWLINKADAYISDRGKLRSEDYKVQQILDYVDGDLQHKEKDIFCVRSHQNIKKNSSKEVNTDMYFESYKDYENYEKDILNQPSCTL